MWFVRGRNEVLSLVAVSIVPGHFSIFRRQIYVVYAQACVVTSACAARGSKLVALI